MTAVKSDSAASHQKRLPFSSVKAHSLFPGRKHLYLHEVADALEVTVPHVITLILEGELLATEITGRGNRTSREHWRVPVGEYDAFIERRRSDKKEGRR